METIERLLYLVAGIILGVVLVTYPPKRERFQSEDIIDTIADLHLPQDTVKTMREMGSAKRKKTEDYTESYNVSERYSIPMPISEEAQQTMRNYIEQHANDQKAAPK